MKTIASSLTGPYTVVIDLLARDQEEQIKADRKSVV